MQKSSSNLQVDLKLILFPFVIPHEKEEHEDALVPNRLQDVTVGDALVNALAEIALEQNEEKVGTLVDTSQDTFSPSDYVQYILDL